MSQSSSPYTTQMSDSSANQFRLPPPNMAQTNNGGMYGAQINAAYYPYGAYTTPDQWMMSPAYYYNSWSYPQPPNTPPATLMQTPPPQLPPNFNPGQPPPPPTEPPKMLPPPPPDTSPTPPKRGRSIYPRGGKNGMKGSSRQNSSSNASPTKDASNLQQQQQASLQKTPPPPPPSQDGGETTSNAVNTETHQVQVHKKPKRKPMSSRYTRKRVWCREDAIKALELESQSSSTAPMLVIHFPDPDLNSHMVKGFSPEIETVHFQVPYKARSCFVKLRQGANIAKVCEEISKIPFGMGFLRAEEKHTKELNKGTHCEGIDPYTLYVGNLPPHITVAEIKENFPTATYIDVGFAQKMKYTRYAFIQYATVEDAMEAYKKTINLMLDKRNLVVRFRRTKGTIDAKLPNPKKSKNSDEKDDDSDCEIISDESVFPKPVEEGTVDSKDNVLREAAKLMRRMLEKDEDFAVFNTEPESPAATPVVGPIINIKREREDDEDEPDNASDALDDTDLLGTQVKSEPCDDHLFDDSYSEPNDEEDDEIPPEEFDQDDPIDDFIFPSFDNGIDDNNPAAMTPDHWENVRRKELEEKEEKPDITALQGNNRDGSEVRPRPSLKLKDLMSEKKDGLDDLFRSMNPESDDDDDL